MRHLAIVVCFALTGLSGSVLAAPNCTPLLQQGCACAVPIDPTAAAPLAQLSDIEGDVLVSGGDGFTPIGGPVPLNVGDSVIVPEGGSARLAAGEACDRELQPETSLVIREIDGCACVAQVEAEVDPQTTGQIQFTPLLPLVLGTGGTITYFALQNNSSSVSP